MVRQGKIRYIGCSNFAAWQLCRALWVSDKHDLERFESVQPEYSFARREIEAELFPLCQEQQVAIISYQVLMGGLLTGTYNRTEEPPADSHMASRHAGRAKGRYWNDAYFDMAEQLKVIAAEVGHTPTQIVLAWALSKPMVASIIAGTSRPEQAAQNAKAADIKLSQEVLERLDSLS